MMKIKQLCDGVLEAYGEESEAKYPERIFWQGQHYVRFMNIFYIHRPCDELTTDQVHVLCRARSKRPKSIGPVNEKVRIVLRRFISDLAPLQALEIGAGVAPIMTTDEASALGITYVISDGDDSNHNEIFSGERANLGYEDGTLDLVVALFVLHFKFFDSQISEIARCLSKDGIFLANMYRRGKESRDALKKQMENYGLAIKIIKDAHELCSAHEYWFIGKDFSRLDHLANDFYFKNFQSDTAL